MGEECKCRKTSPPKENLVNMELEIEDHLFLKVALLAHEKDITINEMFIEIFNQELKKYPDPKEESGQSKIPASIHDTVIRYGINEE